MAGKTADDSHPGATRGVPMDDLVPVVYEALHRVAALRMQQERPDHTLQATALVHEAYLRLRNDGSTRWHSAGHFFSAAAEAMRRILVEHARGKGCLKRGGAFAHISIDGLDVVTPERASRFLALEDALSLLEKTHPRKAEIVKLRYFAGFTIRETARLLQLSPATVKADWTFVRAWIEKRVKDAISD